MDVFRDNFQEGNGNFQLLCFKSAFHPFLYVLWLFLICVLSVFSFFHLLAFPLRAMGSQFVLTVALREAKPTLKLNNPALAPGTFLKPKNSGNRLSYWNYNCCGKKAMESGILGSSKDDVQKHSRWIWSSGTGIPSEAMANFSSSGQLESS